MGGRKIGRSGNRERKPRKNIDDGKRRGKFVKVRKVKKMEEMRKRKREKRHGRNSE